MESITQISKVIDAKISGVVKDFGQKVRDKVESMENVVMNLVDNRVNDVVR